jgi:hypothetical protein
VPCFACLREAASAKVGHAGVGHAPVMKDCSENNFKISQVNQLIINYFLQKILPCGIVSQLL